MLTTIHPLSWIQRLHLLNIRERLAGQRSRTCTTFVEKHSQSTTLTAPCRRLKHTHPHSAECDRPHGAGQPARSPLRRPAFIHRGAHHSATTDGDRPRHASGTARNQGGNRKNSSRARSSETTTVSAAMLARTWVNGKYIPIQTA